MGAQKTRQDRTKYKTHVTIIIRQEIRNKENRTKICKEKVINNLSPKADREPKGQKMESETQLNG